VLARSSRSLPKLAKLQGSNSAVGKLGSRSAEE
jgi:hypothetical protein